MRKFVDVEDSESEQAEIGNYLVSYGECLE